MAHGPIRYQLLSPIPGKLYVCELGLPVDCRYCCLAGPFDTEAEAQAAAGAIEAEHTYYQTRTEIWTCPIPVPVPKSEEFIQAVVKSCLARCLTGTGMRKWGAVAEFMGELRNQGWEESELQKIETAVRKTMAVTG